MAKNYWTKYGWVTEYTEKEKEHYRKEHEKAQEKYVYPSPPIKRGECKYCGVEVEPMSIICEDCYSVEF